MDNLPGIVVAAAAALLAAAILLAMLSKPGGIPVVARPLLTAREREALVALEHAFPQLRVFPQVAMGALIQARNELSRRDRALVRNRFSQKIVDFVLEDRGTGQVVALVELDDRSHNAAKDSRRDEIALAAGYRTIRIPPGTKIQLQVLRAVINDALA